MDTEIAGSSSLDLTFLASPTAPGQVRTLVGFRLTEWRLLVIADDVQLVASELVTNALRSTPDREIRVRLTREPGSVLLGVWDASDELPLTKPITEPPFPNNIVPDPHALEVGHDASTGGRGLPIVEALSARCGVDRTRPHGKWVWSRIAS